MNCPECGAWSNVLDTRNGPNETVKRRRECANGHRFFTLEVLPAAIHQDSAKASARAIGRNRKRWQRDQAIRADGRMHALIAIDHGLTRSQIVRIKRGVRR